MSNTSGTPSGEVDTDRVRARAKVLARADREMKDELIQARIDLGLTQKAVAELLGVSAQAIQKFERYDNDPKLSTLRRYANAVGVIVEHRVTRDVGQSVVMAGRSSWESGTQVRTAIQHAAAAGHRQGAWSKRSSFAMAA